MGTYAMKGITSVFVFVVLCWITIEAKVDFTVKCTEDTMLVEVARTDDIQDIYLEQLQHYPDPACHPVKQDNKAVFRLSLRDIQQCGVTRVANQITGRLVFYHRVVVRSIKKKPAKQVVTVKCAMEPVRRLAKRNVLPAGFQEPEFLEITTNLTEKAPEPMLGVGVRQGGQLVTGELNVNPGTPLQMEIFLDKGSAPIYGLLVSYMQVTDTKAQEETIIFNGCSVDPYLFENFNTVDGDFLSAKFRAFKFPESTYVQFTGTVNVCLDKCRGVDCSNGQTGYGRRKREVSSVPADPNKVFEVTMTTFIKVDYKEDKMLEKGKGDALPAKPRNGTDVAPGDINNHVYDKQQNQNLKLETEEIREELEYTVIDQANAGSTVHCLAMTLAVALFTLALHF